MKDHRKITIQQFLKERDEWRVSAQRYASPGDIIVEPDDFIICDFCNGDIDINLDINIVGSYALCEPCFTKYSRKIT